MQRALATHPPQCFSTPQFSPKHHYFHSLPRNKQYPLTLSTSFSLSRELLKVSDSNKQQPQDVNSEIGGTLMHSSVLYSIWFLSLRLNCTKRKASPCTKARTTTFYCMQTYYARCCFHLLVTSQPYYWIDKKLVFFPDDEDELLQEKDFAVDDGVDLGWLPAFPHVLTASMSNFLFGYHIG